MRLSRKPCRSMYPTDRSLLAWSFWHSSTSLATSSRMPLTCPSPRDASIVGNLIPASLQLHFTRILLQVSWESDSRESSRRIRKASSPQTSACHTNTDPVGNTKPSCICRKRIKLPCNCSIRTRASYSAGRSRSALLHSSSLEDGSRICRLHTPAQVGLHPGSASSAKG